MKKAKLSASRALVDDLVAASRILAQHQVLDAYGHVSARSDGNPAHFIMSRSLAPALLTAKDVMEHDADSEPVNDRRKGFLERFIHGEIYRARPDVTCVVHNYSPSVVPFSVTGVQLKALYHMAAFVGDGLPNFEIRDVQRGSDLLIRNPQLGKALAATLAARPAALMRGHGSVVVGENLPRAVGRSIYLEQSARMQMQALLLAGPGGRITYFDESEVQACVARQDYYRAWPLWREKALALAEADRK